MNMISRFELKIFHILLIVALQFLVDTLIIFDVPVARQIIGFAFFTTIPGFLIIQLIKPKGLEKIEVILFSVGLSVAFLIFAGLLVNETCLLLGVPRPLSSTPLLTSLNILTLTSIFIILLRKSHSEPPKNVTGKSFSPFTLLLLILPITSILGAIWLSTFESNTILLFAIALIALTVSITILFQNKLSPKFYTIAIFLISLSLLFHSAFISKYLMSFGSDIPNEYFVAKSTEVNAQWDSTLFESATYGRMNSMMSLTILPTVYSALLKMDIIYVLKMLYPTLFSFVPLTLFQFWRKNFGHTRAFFAAFLIVSSTTFYTEMLGLGRQMIAELFFALLLFVIFDSTNKKAAFNKICFIIFSIALIVSHYALAEILLGLIAIVIIFFTVTKKPPKKITLVMVLFFFIVMFTWYIYTSRSSVFQSTISFGNMVLEELNQFFSPSSRDPTILRAIGLEAPSTLWNMLSRAFAYLTEFFIAIGFIGLITKRVDIKLDKEQSIFVVVAMVFLAMVILLPGLSKTLNMTRFYHILLFFLAPLFVFGIEFSTKLLVGKHKQNFSLVLLLLVLIPYFLFQTGFVYEFTGTDSWAPISFSRMDKYRLYLWSGYINDQSVLAAEWVPRNLNFKWTPIYVDVSSANTLKVYGFIYEAYLYPLSNTTHLLSNGIVYLGSLNILYNTVVVQQYYNCSTDELTYLEDMNKVYTSGGSEIYKNIP